MHLTSAKMNTRLGWIKIMSQNLCASGDTYTFADIDTVRIDRINTYSTINHSTTFNIYSRHFQALSSMLRHHW